MTNHSLCGVLKADGRDCEVPVDPGTPFNVCRKHLKAISEYLTEARVASRDRTRLSRTCPVCDVRALVASFATQIATCASCGHQISASDLQAIDPDAPVMPVGFRRATPPVSLPPPHVVYYVRVGKLVKIGTTLKLDERLRSYPPDSLLLATEPGTYELERARHRQFRHARAARNEWFRPTPALIEHINTLREQPLTAAELAA